MENRRDRNKTSRRGNSTNRRLDNRVEGFDRTTIQKPQGTEMFAFQNAKPVVLDILKYRAGKGNPFADEGMWCWERTFFVHKGIGADNQKYVCPQMESGGTLKWHGAATGGSKPCPICEHMLSLVEDYQDNKELIKSIRLQERQLFNVCDGRDKNAEVQIFDITHFLFGKILDAELSADRDEGDNEYQDFSEWKSKKGGLSLRITIDKSTYNNREQYKPISVSFQTRKKEYKNMEGKVLCLDSLIKVPTYKQLKKVFMQTDDADTDSESNNKFRRNDVQKVREMSDKQLKRFVIVNDMDVELDDFEDDLDGLVDAVVAEIKEATEEPKGKGKSKGKGKDKKKADDDIEVDSVVTWTDEDDDDMTGVIVSIKGKKATVEDEDNDQFKVPLKDLTLATGDDDDDDGNGDDDDIEVDSDVEWQDDDGEDHEGTVVSIKGKKATVKEKGKKKKVTIAISDLELA